MVKFNKDRLSLKKSKTDVSDPIPKETSNTTEIKYNLYDQATEWTLIRSGIAHHQNK